MNNTTFDFEDGNGPVPAHRHSNGGGWVADTAQVLEAAYVCRNAQIFGYAHVSGNASVFEDARVYGNASVFEDARVYGNARVSGNASVFGNAEVSAQVYGIRRSDGYFFVYVNCADGIKRIQAGCRNFSLKEAKHHWKTTRGDTPLGKETMDIIKHLVKWS